MSSKRHHGVLGRGLTKIKVITLATLAILVAVLATACAGSSAPAPTAAPAQPAAAPAQPTTAPTKAPAPTAAPTAKPTWKPDRPVQLIVSAAAGGGLDINARIITQHAEKYVGQQVQVLNKVGGNNELAINEVSNAKPDGLTMIEMFQIMVTNQYLVKDSALKPDTFRPVVQLAYEPTIVSVLPGSKVDLPLKDFMAYAKAHDGELKAGVGAIWTGHDFTRATMELDGGFKMNRVGFGGGAPSVTALLGGHIDMSINYVSEVYQQIRAGTLRGVGVGGDERSNWLPNIPTFLESGYPNVNWGVWRILALPKSTPDEIVNGWAEALKKTMDDPATKEAYEKAGMTMVYRGPADLVKYIQSEDARYKALISKLGIQPQ